MRSGFVCLPPGHDVGSHSTEDSEELIIALSGEGELVLDGAGSLRLGVNHVAYVPPRTRHNVFNKGAHELRYVYVAARIVG